MDSSKIVRYSASPRVGKFNIEWRLLNDPAERALLKALFSLCIVLESCENESGRGLTYVAASELFDKLSEGEEVPEYRIEMAHDRPFAAEDHEQRRLNVAIPGAGVFGFVAIRKIILRAPPARIVTKAHNVH